MNAITTYKPIESEKIKTVLFTGNLKDLSAEEKVTYYDQLCETINVNPLTMPFSYIIFQGKEILYANRSCTDQLRKNIGLSLEKTEITNDGKIYTVRAYGVDSEGRKDVATGCVNIENLKGDALANAYMKAETKAKRRLTLSMGGLGILDESELETLPKEGFKPIEIKETHLQLEVPKYPTKYLEEIKNCKDKKCLQDLYLRAKEDVELKAQKESYKLVMQFVSDRKGEIEKEMQSMAEELEKEFYDNFDGKEVK